MDRLDVTNKVSFGDPDGESLPLYKCVCGTEFKPWDVIIDYEDGNWPNCHKCGRRFIFRNRVTVYEVGRTQGKEITE
jgi:DNA-directed RNA polymerase subunit RPC12/RpoP